MRVERANAKINLFLDVLSKREDGYHQIASLMHGISLCDLVTLDFSPESYTSVTLQASGNDAMPTDCRNLAWRAAELFLGATGRRGRVSIRIEKHIPMAAGLAGGSTDAAAVLRGLNRLCGSPMSIEELSALGARLGADVPFCIRGGSMLVGGIGEELTSADPLPTELPMVVACMGEGVSTPWAYGTLDRKYSSFDPPRDATAARQTFLQALKARDVELLCASCYNLFEPVVEAERPAVGQIKRVMREHRARLAMMSGSGPSVFGIFSSLADADAACRALCEMGAAAFVCHPTGAAV